MIIHIPSTEEEASQLLYKCNDRFADLTKENVIGLVRFLGANSSAWSCSNRESLVELLSRVNLRVLTDIVIDNVSTFPRSDVIDACKLVLREAVKYRELVAPKGCYRCR